MADKDSGLVAEFKDLVSTLRDYAKQETLGPFQGLGRYLKYGILGAVCMALALMFLLLALLRGLQTIDAFDGNWSVVPYVATVAGAALILMLAILAVARDGSKS